MQLRADVGSVRGVVAAAHPLAAQAGARILRTGGNAFDAAAGTAAALGVVEPFMSGIAGMGVATCHVAAERRIRVLDFVPPAPQHYPDNAARDPEVAVSARFAGVPGALAGWHELVRTHGRLPFSDVLAPAIELAADGFPLSTFAAGQIITALTIPRLQGGNWTSLYTGTDAPPAHGTVLRQPRLAETFAAIASEGIGYLYGGELGRRLVATAREHGSHLTDADLEMPAPTWREPIAGDYRGVTVHAPPPPAESFQFLLTLAILDGFDLGALEPNDVDHLDTVCRAIRLAAMERIRCNLPDEAGLERLMSAATVERLREELADRQRPVDGPTEVAFAPAQSPPAQHTTALSVVDADGNVVSLTQSLGGVFGCGVVVPEHGICLNNLLSFGNGDTKRVAAGGPLALPLAPSLLTDPGDVVLGFGSPGSYGIPQHQTQVLVHHLDYGLNIQAAIEQPRIRLTDGRTGLAEARLGAATVAALNRRGHDLQLGDAWTRAVGGLQAVARFPNSEAWYGGCDPRRDGFVATP